MGFLVTEFLVILGGTILVSGVITGTYRAFQKIYGVSYPALFGDPEKILHEGILPVLILKTGVFSILGLGLSSIFIFSTLRKIEAKMLFFAISIGIILAFIHILLVRKFQFRSPEKNLGRKMLRNRQWTNRQQLFKVGVL